MGLHVALSDQRVLITGVTGFIGKALAAECLSAGCRVRGTVRNITRAADLPADVEPAVVPDAGPDAKWSESLTGVNVVVHLAGSVHQEDSRSGSEHFRINLAGTEALARAAVDAGVQRFVFLSTIKVHGEGGEGPYTESHPYRPHGDYAISKCEAEKALRAFASHDAMEVTILRPPLIYGPGVKANFLKLLDAVARGTFLPLGSVDNRRSLLYLGNLVDAILTTLRRSNAAGSTFMVADAKPVSTPELIREIADLMGTPSRLIPFPVGLLKLAGRAAKKSPQVERLTSSLWADTTEIQTRLGWQPKVSFRQGLAETVAWYRSRLGATPPRLAHAFGR
jgi:nucleoside-diphosphate-sugar epimerase